MDECNAYGEVRVLRGQASESTAAQHNFLEPLGPESNHKRHAAAGSVITHAERTEPLGELADEGCLGVSGSGMGDVKLLIDGDSEFGIDFVTDPGGEKVRVSVSERIAVLQETMTDEITSEFGSLYRQCQCRSR